MGKIGCFFMLIILAGVMLFTNPSKEQHIDNARKMLKERKLDDLGVNADFLSIGEGLLGKDQMNRMVEKFISRNNYYLFSLTQVDLGDDTRTIGFGIFGHIFDIDQLLGN